jgi:hypothetical protein
MSMKKLEKESYDNGKKILRLRSLIDHLKRGNAARIQINMKIIHIISRLTRNCWYIKIS